MYYPGPELPVTVQHVLEIRSRRDHYRYRLEAKSIAKVTCIFFISTADFATPYHGVESGIP